MVTPKVDRTKNVSSYQPSNYISEQADKSQLYTNSNLNAKETLPIQRQVVTNKNDDINNPLRFSTKIYGD